MFCDFLINSFLTQLNELNISLVQWYKWHRMCSRQNFLSPQYPDIYLHQLRAGFAGYGFEQQHFFPTENKWASFYLLFILDPQVSQSRCIPLQMGRLPMTNRCFAL